jgi:hypothetical protein
MYVVKFVAMESVSTQTQRTETMETSSMGMVEIAHEQ